MQLQRPAIVVLVSLIWFGGAWAFIEAWAGIPDLKRQISETQTRLIGGAAQAYMSPSDFPRTLKWLKRRVVWSYIRCGIFALGIAAGFVLFLWPHRADKNPTTIP